MKRVSVSLDTARAMMGVCSLYGIRNLAVRELEAAIAKARRVPKRSLPFKSRKQTKAAKKKTKREQTSEIRAAVMRRAQDSCEACGRGPLPPYGPLEMDHFFSRRVPQSERNCWALCRVCHRQKTDNAPSAAYWRVAFIAHAERHGHRSEAAQARTLLAKHEAKAELKEMASHA